MKRSLAEPLRAVNTILQKEPKIVKRSLAEPLRMMKIERIEGPQEMRRQKRNWTER